MTRKLFIGFIAVLAMSLWFVGCTTDPVPDEIPPVVTIDSPGEGSSQCESFTVEGSVRDTDPGLASVTLFVDGVEVDNVAISNNAASYNFEFNVTADDFPADCGDAEIEVVAQDGEGNEASEKMTVVLCNDTTTPIVTLTPATSELYNEQCADIAISVTEDNYVSYEYFLNGNLEGSGDGTLPTTLTYCCDDLDEGVNTVTFEITDYCGNMGVGAATITCGDVTCGVSITYPDEDECLCGEVTFTADADIRAMPTLAEVCFYFDGEDVPRHCDDTPPYEWTVNVNDTFEPETHVVYAVGVLDDGNECESAPVSWVKSCEPEAVLEVVSIDHCNRMVTVNAGFSSDDNVEPGLTYMFDAPTCAGNWSHDQSAPGDATVTFTFDTETCGYGDYDIFVTVYDGWCDGEDTATITATLIDDCFGDLAFSNPTSIGVYGDFQATWPLAATANDRLVMPELTVVDFSYDIAASVPPGEPDFGALCSAADNGDGTWGCDFDSADLPAVGGYYYFHVTSTDNAENTQWAAPQMFWKSDMPAGLNLVEEHEDGNYYDNGFASLPFTVTFTDDNLADLVTTYDVVWDFSDGTHYETTVGALAPGTSAITHTFDALGSYTLDVYIVEYTPDDAGGVMVTSLTETWTICLENDPPIFDEFDVENIQFSDDEGPYGDDGWINPRTELVSEQGYLNNEPSPSGIVFACDDPIGEASSCVSECDSISIHIDNGVDPPLNTKILASDEYFDVNWDSFDPGMWTVSLICSDKAGNIVQATEEVIKSNYPSISNLSEYTNYWNGEWWSYQDPPGGIPVQFDEWIAEDDNGGSLDSLVWEFNGGTEVWTERLWGYDENYSLPWTYYFNGYGEYSAYIWSSDQYGQWSRSDMISVVTSEPIPEWTGRIQICEVEGQPLDPILDHWAEVSILSPSNVDFCFCYEDDDLDLHPETSIVRFFAFDPALGWNGNLEYWSDLYGEYTLGTGYSSKTGLLASRVASSEGCSNDDWETAAAEWLGYCGYFYVYAQAENSSGELGPPSAPIIVAKSSAGCFPSILLSDCFTANLGESTQIEAIYNVDCGECSEPDSVKFYWYFDDLPVIQTNGPEVEFISSMPGWVSIIAEIRVWSQGILTHDSSEAQILVGDRTPPLVTNLDKSVGSPNDNDGNEGFLNAHYGIMSYAVSAIDSDGILQGPDDGLAWTVEVSLWTDNDGLSGGFPVDQIEVVRELENDDCHINEKEWVLDFDWSGKDRGYYWMRARARDRFGNLMGQDTPKDPGDDYFSIQIYHADPPQIEILCDYTGMHQLEFIVRDDCMQIYDDGPITPLFKTQWELSFSGSFDYDLEYDYGNEVRLDYYASGNGYGSHTAAVRAVDTDGIYSIIRTFPVQIEDYSEPCVVWVDPLCGVFDGKIDFRVWASDYIQSGDGARSMPCISRVEFLVNDVYAATSNVGIDLGQSDICDGVGPVFEFSVEDFPLSSFLDSVFGSSDCGFGGEVELEARAYDCDGNQSGDLSITVCESNEPVVHDGADDCDWAFDGLTATVDFTDFICDDNPLDYIVVDWDDGSVDTVVDWANAGAVQHTYDSVGCYDITVQVYDYYSTAGRCCDGDSGGPWLDWTSVGSIFIDQEAPTVELTGWSPAHEDLCVTEDPFDDIEIIMGDFADNSDGCFEGPGIAWVKFWLSDDQWENREYLGMDNDFTDDKWNVFWNPWNQEAKDIWIGVEIMDCAGNSAEFFMTPGVDPGDTYWFNKDLKPWYPLIDQHEVWALIHPAGTIPFEGEADNDPSDVTDFSWFWDSDDCDDPSYTGATVNVNPAILGATPGDYILTMAAEDDCFTYCDEANFDTALLHLCDDDEGPVITWVSPDPAEDVEGTTFDFCFTVDDCFFWDEGLVSVVSASGDTIFTFPFQSAHQWHPEWDPYYSYVSPGDAELFCYSFPTGTEDCSDWDDLGYNPFADGNDFDVVVEATDYDPNTRNTTTETETFTISDVLAPYVLDEGFWYGDDYDVIGEDESPLDGASIDFDYNGGNAVISVDVIDWHCSKIDSVVFVFEEPAGEWEYVNADNVFGVDTTPADGFTALLNLPTPRDDSYRVGVFIWDIHGNESVQMHVNFFVSGTVD